ncbi:hypothetical protein K1719_002981 [Acacia pycnantha]|nr:hypothetical protein K1719_047585 [Acacia pycnantha]KAI9125563.1 hypothetical protein K1719_002981 [Acacia pycnantha]
MATSGEDVAEFHFCLEKSELGNNSNCHQQFPHGFAVILLRKENAVIFLEVGVSLEQGTFPTEVEAFRQKILEADSILFASPKYNLSVIAPVMSKP